MENRVTGVLGAHVQRHAVMAYRNAIVAVTPHIQSIEDGHVSEKRQTGYYVTFEIVHVRILLYYISEYNMIIHCRYTIK